MDEYTPRKFDIARLKFLCDELYLTSSELVKDQASVIIDPVEKDVIQLFELIEHIANYTVNYKLKHTGDIKLTTNVNEFLDETFTLFSNCTIKENEFKQWQDSTNRLFNLFSIEETLKFNLSLLTH